jgi:PAS domain S-box-containing protein
MGRKELILRVSTEGFCDRNFQNDRAFLSPRYCELAGCSPAGTTFDAHFFRSLVHPEDWEMVRNNQEARLQMKNSDVFVVEYRMISKDGTIRWIEERGKAVAFAENGTVSRIAGTIVDVTERKRAEVLLRESGARPPSADKSVQDADRNLETAIARANLMAEQVVQAHRAKGKAGSKTHYEAMIPATRVLVVDDLQQSRDLLRKMLGGSGFLVEEARNGSEAVFLAHRSRPDIVLMDRRTPVMDGMDAALKIKAMPGGSEIKVIVIASIPQEELPQETLANCADGFVRKPFLVTEIMEEIRRLRPEISPYPKGAASDSPWCLPKG